MVRRRPRPLPERLSDAEAVAGTQLPITSDVCARGGRAQRPRESVKNQKNAPICACCNDLLQRRGECVADSGSYFTQEPAQAVITRAMPGGLSSGE